MEFRTLGRTGLRVSALGQGCGGPSVLGAKYGWEEERRADVLRNARQHGITFFDTSQFYSDSEEMLGKWLPDDPGGAVVISTKTGTTFSPDEFEQRFEQSLAHLQRDHIDILLFHDLMLDTYDHAVADLVPKMLKWKEQGRIRAIGFSQACPDQEHSMGWRGLKDAHLWDVMLLTYSVFSQQLRFELLPRLQDAEVGVLSMNAVRKDLFNYAAMDEALARHCALGVADVPHVDEVRALLEGCGCRDLPEAVHRFVCHTPGVHVTLSGSTSPEHIRANVEAVCKGPLPQSVEAQLIAWFRQFRFVWE